MPSITPPTFADPNRYAIEMDAEFVERAAIAPEQVSKMAEAGVGHTPSEVVYEENKVQLHRYTPEEVTHEIPIVIVYALINKPYILDLQPNTSVIETLLENGFEVYLVDWGAPTRLDQTVTLEDYVCRYLDNCIGAVRDSADVDEVHLLGYCIGGTFAVMYTALFPEKVRSLGTMALAFSFDGDSGIYETWVEHVDADLTADAIGNIPEGPMAVIFTMKEPVNNYATRFFELYERLVQDQFVEMFARIEQWSWDGVDITAETFRQFIGDIYQDNLLEQNDLSLGEKHIDLTNIDVPVMQVIGEHDTIAPPASSRPLRDCIESEDYREFAFPTGHFGVSISPSAHRDLWPDVADWYAERDGRGAGAESAEKPSQTGTGERQSTAAGPSEAPSQNGNPETLRSVEGIGPTYAARLESAGIERPADLLAFDAEELADITEASPIRATDWLDQVA